MIRKLIIIIAGFYGFFVLTTILQSCDLLSYDATICDIYFTGIKNFQSDSEPDDLTQEIGFVIRAKDYCTSAFNFNDLNLISSCYATTKCADWQNGLNESSFELSFDKLIIFNNDTIKPNQDLLKIASIKTGIKIVTTNECKFILSRINFSDELRNKLLIDTGIYNVTFKCKTTDGKEFEKQRKVILRK